MLHNNICTKVPNRPKPTTLSLTPNVTAAPFLVLVELELEPVLVAEPEPVEMPVGLATWPLQLLVPAMALLSVISLQLEVISDVLSMFEPPETMVSFGRETDEKFPVKSIAPPMVESWEKEMPFKAELLAIWTAPPTDVRPGMVMLARLGLATMAKLPLLPPKLPTVVKFGALSDVK